MSKFAVAMNVSATTQNGALSYASPDPVGNHSGRLSLFFKGVRGLNVPKLYEFLRSCAQEDLVDTFLLAFNLRDCRGGKGERALGRQALMWLFINYPDAFRQVMPIIPDYGRWDDLLCLFPRVLDLQNLDQVRANFLATVPGEDTLVKLRALQQDVVKMMADRLRLDKALMDEGKPCSICAKWTPTEGDSLDRKANTFATLATSMGISRQELRRTYNTPLRAYVKVVETYICSGKWSKINFSKVPSCAMKRLKKAFAKHDPDRFNAWRIALKLNDPKVAKVNAKQLYPHELVREVRQKTGGDPVTEAQWKVLIDEVRKLGSLKDAVAVIDTSGSMAEPNYVPLDVAVALGMVISDVVEGPFHGHVISFNTVPQFTVVPDGCMFDRWHAINHMTWGGSTNLEGTFQLILDRARSHHLSKEDMPKRLFIISDMQFNNISTRVTNWERINELYASSGYTRPQIVFWNVNGGSDDFPVTVGEQGTAMISGFSPAILKALLKGEELSPLIVLRHALDDARYDPVRKALGGQASDDFVIL